MSDTRKIRGQCLCGAVQVKAEAIEPTIGACHCRQCRQWTSSPLQTVDCDKDAQFSGEDNIGIFNSSDWAERGFCKQCGSALFYRLKETGHLAMAAGLFDNLEGFVFDHEVFIDEKPAFYAFANPTQQMTGQQVFDYFASQQD